MNEPVLVVHGGAGELPESKTQAPGRKLYEDGLAAALRAGQEVLLAGKSAVDAVCAAVVALEDNECFNAGKGAVLCADGRIELSASVMDGRDRSVGAMVGLTRTRNPVLGAHAMMPHMHGLLYGAEADAYGERNGLAMVSPDYFVTPLRRKQWERVRATGEVVLDHSAGADAHGTVGAVARDRNGSLAAATSTGGVVNQLAGRVGDTPVVGAGTWADDRSCALSTTGKGDAFARVAFARRVADLVELMDMSGEAAAMQTLEDVRLVGGEGGCILLMPDGRVVCPFNSAHMLRGHVVGSAKPVVGILPGEEVVVS